MIPVITHYWVIKTKDGRKISQFADDGSEVPINKVPHEIVESVAWDPITESMASSLNGSKNFLLVPGKGSILVDTGSKPFKICRRMSMQLISSNNSEIPLSIPNSYVLGVEGGPYYFLTPDGRVYVSNDYNFLVQRR